MNYRLTKEFAKVLIKDYEGFIDTIKDMDGEDAYAFLVGQQADCGLCFYSIKRYDRNICETILSLIPGIYISSNPTTAYSREGLNGMLKALQDRVDWLNKHMEHFDK